MDRPAAAMDDPLNDTYLPYTAAELADHFVRGDGTDVELHLKKWRSRIAASATKDPERDPTFLDRDETLWTAGALLATHRAERWAEVLPQAFGEAPPLEDELSWDEALSGPLRLFFEVGLSSPPAYRQWLAEHAAERHPLPGQVALAARKGTALEGRTHLDAMLLAEGSGLSVHFEAKVLSDIDTKTTFDALRNQLARNLDCLLEPTTALPRRRPERSLLALLTPRFFRDRPASRLYGRLFDDYKMVDDALHRDLPHRSPEVCADLARRLGWLTFEDLRAPWLDR